MTTAIKPLLVLQALLVCGRAIGAPVATMETLLRTIAEGEGRAVYEAFKGIPEVANTTEKQEKAFEGLSIYVGQTDKYCVVRDYYRPETRVTQKSFSYAELAGESIRDLGEPGRRGLVKFLTSKPKPVAAQAGLVLCGIEESAIVSKGRPESKNFPPLDAGARKALEAFLQKWGDSFPVHALTRFYRAGFPAAAGYMHAILKATRDPGEKHSAAIYLGSYGYAPALDDLLKIFKDTPDASLRGSVRESLRCFTDSDRVTSAQGLPNSPRTGRPEGRMEEEVWNKRCDEWSEVKHGCSSVVIQRPWP